MRQVIIWTNGGSITDAYMRHSASKDAGTKVKHVDAAMAMTTMTVMAKMIYYEFSKSRNFYIFY